MALTYVAKLARLGWTMAAVLCVGNAAVILDSSLTESKNQRILGARQPVARLLRACGNAGETIREIKQNVSDEIIIQPIDHGSYSYRTSDRNPVLAGRILVRPDDSVQACTIDNADRWRSQ